MHVVGPAVGGWIAQLLALDHPGSVATLTLIGTRPTAPGPNDPDLPEHGDDVLAHLINATEPDWTDRATVLDHMASTHGTWPGGAGSTRTTPGPGPAACSAGPPGGVRRCSARLGAITAPTLVVHGAHDPFFPLGNSEALSGAPTLIRPVIAARCARMLGGQPCHSPRGDHRTGSRPTG